MRIELPRHLPRTSAAVLATAVIGSLGTDVRSHWYRSLGKPAWQPPGVAFGPAWTTLHGLLSLASARAGRMEDPRKRRVFAAAFGTNLALNASWNWVFFKARRPRWALAEIILLEASTIDLTRRAGRADRTAATMLAPYAGWVAFATALNAAIARRNPATDSRPAQGPAPADPERTPVGLQKTVTVDKPVDNVFAYLSDFATTTEWDPGTVQTVRIAGGRGCRHRVPEPTRFAGRQTQLTYVVHELVPNQRLALPGENTTVIAHDTMTFRASGGGTEVAYTADSTFKGLTRFLAPLLKPALNRLGDRAEAGMRDARAQLGPLLT